MNLKLKKFIYVSFFFNKLENIIVNTLNKEFSLVKQKFFFDQWY